MTTPKDLVTRITEHINSFPRSQVKTTGESAVVMAVARQTDTIKHSSFFGALAGAVAGALVSGAILGACSFFLGGFGGFAVGMVILNLPIVDNAINSIKDKVAGFFESDTPDGEIIFGDSSVLVNGLPIAFAALENQTSTISCHDHSSPQKIAQGSETVFVNGNPVARIDDRTTCDAKINKGSPNVFMGSGRATVAPIEPEFSAWQRALLIGIEFVIPPSAIFGKGLGKALGIIGKTTALQGVKAGAFITGKLLKSSLKNSVLGKGFSRQLSNLRNIKTQTLLEAGNKLDKGGFTKAGRALQKHSSRSGSIFPKVSGTVEQINKQGESVLKSIITNPSTNVIKRHHPRFGDIIEYKSPNGGARFNEEGKNFIGFLEI